MARIGAYYPHRDHACERKSSFYASLSSIGLIGLLCAAIFTLMLSGPATVVGTHGAAGAVRVMVPVEVLRLSPDKLPPMHRLLSEVRVPESPAIPALAAEPEPRPLPEPVPVPEEKPLPKPKKKARPKKAEPPPSGAVLGEEERPGAESGVRNGNGLGDGSGTGSGPGVAGAITDESHILAELLRVVEANKKYPKKARRIGAQGKVTLQVKIDGQGQVRGYALTSFSGNAILDNAARELAGKLVGLRIVSAKNSGGLTVTIPVHYVLK